MAEVGIDSVPKLSLIGLIVELKRLPVIFFEHSIPCFRVIVVIALVVHHFYLVVHQSHGAYLLL